jgi:mRNA-degrading endonuclease toxin of MazEF toxin-antitoxin module
MPWRTNPRRGDVVRVKLDPVVGSEQARERPALVIFPDLINDQGPIILIAVILFHLHHPNILEIHRVAMIL